MASAALADQFQYDSLGRLIRVTYSSGAVVEYSYDAAGNRTTVVSALNAGRSSVAVSDDTNVPTATLPGIEVNENGPDTGPVNAAIAAATPGGAGAAAGQAGDQSSAAVSSSNPAPPEA